MTVATAILTLALTMGAPALAAAQPAGQMTWALHFTPAPTLFEPAETPGLDHARSCSSTRSTTRW